MTRETKLALILGFALVMVVGVLISDHLAGSSRTPVADLTVGLGEHASTRPGVAIDEPPAEHAARPGATAGPVRLVPSQPLVQLDQGSGQRDPVTTPTPGDFDDAMDRARDSVDSLGDLFDPASRATPPAPREESSRPEPASQVWHTVAEDESLWEIAVAYYGKGSRWPEIAAANPGRIGADGAVRAGVKITIPGGRADRVVPVAAEPEPATDGADSYTVKAGDTLGQIAQRLLGTVKRADEIVALNASVISNADEIRVGMVLRMPPR